MVSYKQQDHDIVDKIKATLNSLEKKVKKQKVQLQKLECSITNKFQVIQETMNLFLRHQENMNLLLQTSALPSVISSESRRADSRSLQLCFKFEGNFPDAFLTKIGLEDEIDSLTVEVCDHTGKRVEVVPECLKGLKVKFMVLDGDLNDDWTEEDFRKYIVIPRKDKPPLLKDNCEVSLSNGSARVCGFSFTDNSKSMRNGRFRLGAQPINGDSFGWIVRSAVSPPFKVKENRLKAGRKHKIPKPADKLYHLKNISKTGEIYRRAKKKDVDTVMDFLRLYHTNESELQSILGITAAKLWKETVDNAKECDLTKERSKYIYHDDASGNALLLKCDFSIESVTFKGQTSLPYELLDEFQKEQVVELRKTAYKNQKELRQVIDSVNPNPTSGLEYQFSVEQQEEGEHEQMHSNPSANHGEPEFQFDISKFSSFSSTFEDCYMMGCDSTLEANQLMQEYTSTSLLMGDPSVELSNQEYNWHHNLSLPTHAQNTESGEFRHVPTSPFRPYPSNWGTPE